MKTFQDQLGELGRETAYGSRDPYERLPEEARKVLMKFDQATSDLEKTLHRIEQKLDAGGELHLKK